MAGDEENNLGEQTVAQPASDGTGESPEETTTPGEDTVVVNADERTGEAATEPQGFPVDPPAAAPGEGVELPKTEAPPAAPPTVEQAEVLADLAKAEAPPAPPPVNEQIPPMLGRNELNAAGDLEALLLRRFGLNLAQARAQCPDYTDSVSLVRLLEEKRIRNA